MNFVTSSEQEQSINLSTCHFSAAPAKRSREVHATLIEIREEETTIQLSNRYLVLTIPNIILPVESAMLAVLLLQSATTTFAPAILLGSLSPPAHCFYILLISNKSKEFGGIPIQMTLVNTITIRNISLTTMTMRINTCMQDISDPSCNIGKGKINK